MLSNENMRLGVVKFYGPKRNAKDHLWGFVSVGLGLNESEEVHIVEPNVQGHLKDGMLVQITIERNGNRLVGKDVSEWQQNLSNSGLLLNEVDRYISQKKPVPNKLVSALEVIPADLLSMTYIPFLSDEAIAKKAGSSLEFLLSVLNQCIENKRSLKWCNRAQVSQTIPIASARELVRRLEENLIAIDSDFATWLLQNSELGKSANIRELLVLSESIARTYVSALPISELVAVLPQLPADQVGEILKKHDGRLLVTNAELHQLWKFFPEERIHTLIRESSDSELNFNELSKVLGTSEVLGVWRQWFGKAHQEQRGQLRMFLLHELRELMDELSKEDQLRLSCWGLGRGFDSVKYSEVASDAVRQLTALDGSHDLMMARKIQAKILLSLPPETVRAMAEQGNLLGEFEHLHLDATSSGAIREKSTCDGSRDPLGHAFGQLAVVTISKKKMREEDRSLIMTSLIHAWDEKNKNQVGAEEVINALQSWIINLTKNGELVSHLGELTQILPPCRENVVQFCEGKPPTGDFTTPYCPRLNEGCSRGIVKPLDPTSTSEIWSIMDLLGTSGTSARTELFGRTLINSVAGWGNRIYEITKRMFCDSCEEPLLVNLEYSKRFDAAYSMTRASCSANCGKHDVYFSHCYNCKEVIDSRESRFVQLDDGTLFDTGGDPDNKRTGKYFICIHCANDGIPWCPSCGKQAGGANSGLDGDGRQCGGCGHRVNKFPRKSRLNAAVQLQPPPFASIENEDFEVNPLWKSSPGIQQALKLFAGKDRYRF